MTNHILIEAFCFCDKNEDGTCVYANRPGPTYSCMFEKCPHFAYTSCEDSLCFINSQSHSDEIISLGGEMIPDGVSEEHAKALWRDISLRKLNEAYDEYMQALRCEQNDKA